MFLGPSNQDFTTILKTRNAKDSSMEAVRETRITFWAWTNAQKLAVRTFSKRVWGQCLRLLSFFHLLEFATLMDIFFMLETIWKWLETGAPPAPVLHLQVLLVIMNVDEFLNNFHFLITKFYQIEIDLLWFHRTRAIISRWLYFSLPNFHFGCDLYCRQFMY